MPLTVAESYSYCQNVAKSEAKNFYYSFSVLSPEKKNAMCAIYAFMRFSDDISDEAAVDDTKRQGLVRWRAELDLAYGGDYGDSKMWPAFHDACKRYHIPRSLFHELIDGVEMDLDTHRYNTFDELYKYCYKVASVVGLVCVHVWGFDGGDLALEYAEACGIAFQMTNILRDVKEDAERGRIYLPLEDLQSFGVTEDSVLNGKVSSEFYKMLRFEADRANQFYDKALPLIPLIHAESRSAFLIMFRIYRCLLERIIKLNYRVYDQRASLPTSKKISIVASTYISSKVRKLLARSTA